MPNVGYATLTVIPSMRGFKAQLEGQGDPIFKSSGKKAGQTYGSALSQAAAIHVGGSLTKVLGTATRSVVNLGGAALGAATTGIAAIGSYALAAGASFNVLNQTSFAAFKTILGSSDAANKMVTQLNDFAKSSPFPKQAFIQGTQQLLGFGLSAEKVIPALQAIQDATAAVGGNAQDIAQITFALAEIQGQGKLTGQTLNQLGQYGIDAASIIAKQMGTTSGAIRDMASKPGGIPAAKVWDPLIAGLEGRFGGAAANVKKTMVGSIDRIKAALRDIGSDLLAPFVGLQGGGAAVVAANKIADAFRSLEKQVIPSLLPLVQSLAAKFADAVTKASMFVSRLQGSEVTAFLTKMTGLGASLGAVGGIFTVMAGRNIPFFGQALAGVNPLVAGLVGALLSTRQGRDAILEVGRALMTGLRPVFPILRDAVNTFASGFAHALQTIAPILPDLIRVLAQFAASFAKVAADILPMAASAFATLLRVAMPILDFLSRQKWLVETLVVAWASMKILITVATWLSVLVSAANPVTAAMLAISLAIGGLVLGLTHLIRDAFPDATKAGRDLATQARQTGTAIEDLLTSKLADIFSKSSSFRDELARVGVSLRDIRTALFGSKSAWQTFLVPLQEFGNQNGWTPGYTQMIFQLDNLRRQYLSGKLTQDEFKRAMGDLGVATDATGQQFQTLDQRIHAYLDTVFAAQNAQDGLQRNLNDLGTAVKDAATNGLNLNDAWTGNSNAAIDLRGKLTDLVTGASDVISAWSNQGIQGQQLTDKVNLLKLNIADMAQKAGLPIPVVQELLRRIGEIPTSKTIQIVASSAEALQSISRVSAMVDGLHGKTIDIYTRVHGNVAQHSGPVGRAIGGPVAAGQPYVVGEKGWEIFVPPTAGRIVPHHEAVAASRQAGQAATSRSATVPAQNGQTFLPVAVQIDGREIARALVKLQGAYA